jgi:hypothetical protein
MYIKSKDNLNTLVWLRILHHLVISGRSSCYTVFYQLNRKLNSEEKKKECDLIIDYTYLSYVIVLYLKDEVNRPALLQRIKVFNNKNNGKNIWNLYKILKRAPYHPDPRRPKFELAPELYFIIYLKVIESSLLYIQQHLEEKVIEGNLKVIEHVGDIYDAIHPFPELLYCWTQKVYESTKTVHWFFENYDKKWGKKGSLLNMLPIYLKIREETIQNLNIPEDEIQPIINMKSRSCKIIDRFKHFLMRWYIHIIIILIFILWFSSVVWFG